MKKTILITVCAFALWSCNSQKEEKSEQDKSRSSVENVMENLLGNKVAGLCADAIEVLSTSISFETINEEHGISYEAKVEVEVLNVCNEEVESVSIVFYDENKERVSGNYLIGNLMVSKDRKTNYADEFNKGLKSGNGNYFLYFKTIYTPENYGFMSAEEFAELLPKIKYYSLGIDRIEKSKGKEILKF